MPYNGPPNQPKRTLKEDVAFVLVLVAFTAVAAWGYVLLGHAWGVIK